MGSSPHFSPPARNRCGSLPESNLAASKSLIDQSTITLGSRKNRLIWLGAPIGQSPFRENQQ